MAKKDFLKVTVYAAVFGLIGGMSFQGANYLVSNKEQTKIEGNIQPGTGQDSDTGLTTNNSNIVNTTTSNNLGGSVAEISQSVLPSIVAIDVSATVTDSDFFGRSFESQKQGSGSGIIIGQNNNEILIATNNHVVDDATNVEVLFNDEKKVKASVKGKDSTTDLAVVSVNTSDVSKETLSAIKVAKLGDSKKVEVGQQAIAIGNALGYGTSVTVGYISAKDRNVGVEDSSMKLLQTDAAINPGNSGGALVNSKGEVIGINSAKFASTEVEGMGFAIPISDAVPIINDLMNRQKVDEDQQAYLGIVGQDVTEQYSEQFGMPIGIYIGKTADNSPAKNAGMVSGDIITKFNNKAVKTLTQLQENLSYCKAGEQITLTIQKLSDGKYVEKEVKVTLGSKADQVKK